MDKDCILLEPSSFTVEEWGSTTLGTLQQSLYYDVGVDVPAPLIPHAQEALSSLVGTVGSDHALAITSQGAAAEKTREALQLSETLSC